MYCVIMAGGTGTRFWPRSRAAKSKQFLTIQGKRSLIQETVSRISSYASGEHLYIVSQRSQRDELLKHVGSVPEKNFIFEPEGKNTAPCLGLTALHIQKRNAEAIMIVLPADHLIGNKQKFKKTIFAGVQVAREHDSLVTIGITPDRPATGYGYIQRNTRLAEISKVSAYTVKTFAEKPDLETARRFLESGDFFWNSGMFIFKVSTFLKAVEEYLPELYDALMDIRKVIGKPEYETVLKNVYRQIKNISIDYGVMEKAANVMMVEGDFEWNDLGSWEQVYLLSRKDKDGNAINGRAVCIDTVNSYVDNDSEIIALVGCEDLIVVKEGGVTLICKRDRAEDVKKAVETIRKKKYSDFL
ncbi:mannose-1-phosphate guanylyltransferase [bacterium]|nr:mannose-1-phosphate guanylyltransferase [bacterium]